MKQSSVIFHFLIAILFSLLIMLFDSLSWLGWFRGSIEIIFRPETRALSLASDAIAQSIASAKYISSGPARIADLERRLAAAEREAIFSVRRQEKTEASSVLDWAVEQGFRLIPAQVLSFGPQLIIEIPLDNKCLTFADQQMSDICQVSGGQPVVSPGGALVGSIAALGRWSARVKLLSDSGSQIPVAVLTPDKQKMAKGILTGAFGASLTLEKVLTEVELQPDLAVVTTGEDDLFPPDLLVGWIGKTGPKQASSLYQAAQIVPAAEISGLKIVFIIL